MPILEALRQLLNLLLVDPAAKLANAFFGHPQRPGPGTPGWTLAQLSELYPRTSEPESPIIRALQGKR